MQWQQRGMILDRPQAWNVDHRLRHPLPGQLAHDDSQKHRAEGDGNDIAEQEQQVVPPVLAQGGAAMQRKQKFQRHEDQRQQREIFQVERAKHGER